MSEYIPTLLRQVVEQGVKCLVLLQSQCFRKCILSAKEAYERPNELSLEVGDALIPGKTNVIALRVNTSLNHAAGGGLQGRVFLYSL